MIVSIQAKKDLRVNLEKIWNQLNDLKVAMFFLKENENAIYEAKRFVDKFEGDKRLEKISDAFDYLEDWVDLECFEDMEKETGKVMEVIDREFFDGALFKKFIEEDDEEEL